jgi:uncharacterized protein (DUF433 family)
MGALTREKDFLAGGFYTLSEAARLLRIENPKRLSRWLAPSEGREPIIRRQYPKLAREHEIGFLDLLEIRFVEHFRRQKISLQSLRVAARNARRELKVAHPFATSNVKFQSDRREIFLETAKEIDDRVFLNLMTNQVEIYEVIEQTLARDLEFDVGGFAKLWRPAPDRCPTVEISPLYAFGRPVVQARKVPTIALFKMWRAEGGSYEAAADWFEVPNEQVREAVEFEVSLAV